MSGAAAVREAADSVLTSLMNDLGAGHAPLRSLLRDALRLAANEAVDAVAERIRAAEREACARLLTSDDAVSTAAKASDEWFGKDGDLQFGLSETSKAQARVELAAVADLIRAQP